MDTNNIFNSFTRDILLSINNIDNNYENIRFSKKRKIDEINYTTEDKDLIYDDMDEDINDLDDIIFICNKDTIIKRVCPHKKWKYKKVSFNDINI
jgi:hypothetical protein